jgi:hypothetical protein
MGCDIHMYVEYKRKDDKRNNWSNFGSRINPGRNYFMFGLLSKGVRSDNELGIDAKGLPDGLGWETSDDMYLYINDNRSEDDNHVSTNQAIKWRANYGCNIVNDENGRPYKVENPDWHSSSWLTTSEFENQLNIYNQESFGVPEYMAILAAMKELENHNNECRVVFWFDN